MIGARILDRLRNSVLIKNTALVLAGQATRSAIQLVYFVVIARALGPGDYGAFVATTALVGLAAPFATMGAGEILVMQTARNPSAFGNYWGRALLVAPASGASLTVVLVVASRLILPDIAVALLLCIALADVVFARLLDLSGQAFQAFDQLGRTTHLLVLLSALRLVAAAGLFLLVSDPTPLQWAALYLGTTVAAAAYGLWTVHRHLGTPDRQKGGLRADLRLGSLFAVSLSAQTAYNDIDKTMLGSLATVEAAGIYGVAYRIVDALFKPIHSVLASSFASFFRHGARGLHASKAYALRFLPWSVAYGLAAALLLFLVAPLLPIVLGSGFSRSVEALRWLSVIPLLKGIHFFAAIALTAAGKQALRTLVQVAIAVLNVGLNLLLIPQYSWRGAAWASIATDSLLAVALWAAVLRLGDGRDAPPPTDAEDRMMPASLGTDELGAS
ncbi:MAG: oligosaccharide flippase family protein [Actinomycetota bacterium]|nr:oligosaccharide flippase family protein [Actinomycetota bacterium]